jgi:hypothetical protein
LRANLCAQSVGSGRSGVGAANAVVCETETRRGTGDLDIKFLAEQAIQPGLFFQEKEPHTANTKNMLKCGSWRERTKTVARTDFGPQVCYHILV